MAEQAQKTTPQLQSTAELATWKRTGTKVQWQLLRHGGMVRQVHRARAKRGAGSRDHPQARPAVVSPSERELGILRSV